MFVFWQTEPKVYGKSKYLHSNQTYWCCAWVKMFMFLNWVQKLRSIKVTILDYTVIYVFPYFKIMINCWKPLTIATKSFILRKQSLKSMPWKWLLLKRKGIVRSVANLIINTTSVSVHTCDHAAFLSSPVWSISNVKICFFSK